MRILGVVSSSSREVPNAPTIGTATDVGTGRAFNNGAATVTFTAPTFDGGLPITGYTVTSSPGGFTGTGSASPITVTGLQSNNNYTFTVRATNAVGQSAASAASNSILATTVPQAPTIGTATATGSSTATVGFTGNATGGKAISTYTATSSPGSLTGSSATSPITVSGLTAGTAYTFTVTATNANGTSTASAASNSITPSLPAYLFTYGRGIGGQQGGWSGILSNGNTVVSTTVPGSNTPGSYYILNSSGAIQSQRRLSGGSNLSIYGGGVDNSDNIVMGGYGPTNANSGIFKVNSSGTVLWAKNDGGGIYAYHYRQFNFDSSNNFYYLGRQQGLTYPGWAFLSTDTNGNFRYAQNRNNTRTVAYYLTPPVGDNSGNMYGAFTSSTVNGLSIFKTDSTGSPILQYTVSPGNVVVGCGLAIDTSGNTYTSSPENTGTNPVTIMQWNTSLNYTWQRKLTPPTGLTAYDQYHTIRAKSNTDIFVLIPWDSNGAGTYNWVIARYNTSGSLQWQRQWSASTFIFANQFSTSSLLLDGNDYILTVPLNGGGVMTIRAPQDGSKTGTYAIGGTNYTYSASSFSDSAGSYTYQAFPGLTASNPSYSNTAGITTVAGSQTTELTTF